jgi:hypothetical protein
MKESGKIKMQNVAFRNIEEFFEFLPDNEFKITKLLRRTVFDCIPNITEKLSYNVPFYSQHRTICFIWPASVLWGKKKTYEGVRFGFSNGHLLSDESTYLSKGNRKQVYWIDFTGAKDIDIDLLRSYIFEAVQIDEFLNKKQSGIQRKSADMIRKRLKHK